MKKPLLAGSVAAPEEPGVALRDGPRAGPVADPQAAGDLAVAAARTARRAPRCARPGAPGVKRGTPFVPAMFACETSRHRLRQPIAERASSTRCGPRPRSPIPRRSSLTGSRWPGSRARSGRGRTGDAVDDGAARRDRVVRCPSRRRRRGRRGAITHPSGSGDGRVEQLDLEPDDRVQPDGLGRADEADRAVQAGVVGDGQPGQPQLDGPLDQVVRRRGAVEEREVRVAVEFGVRDRVPRDRSGRWAGRSGAGQYRTSVLTRYARSHPDQRRAGQIARRGVSLPGMRPTATRRVATPGSALLLALVLTPLAGLPAASPRAPTPPPPDPARASPASSR